MNVRLRKLLIFLFLGASLNGFSQIEYFNETSSWRWIEAGGASGYDYDLTENDLSIIGTEILNDKEYFKGKLIQRISRFQYISDILISIEYDTSFIYLRQEQKKVFRYYDDFHEQTLYDFDLAIGDTTYVTSFSSPQIESYAVVVDIDTVDFNGESRSIYLIDDFQIGGPLRVIYEGVGSEMNILDPAQYYFGGSFVLLCFKKDGECFPLDHETSYPFDCDPITKTKCYFNEESYWKWNYFGNVNDDAAHEDIAHELKGNGIVEINDKEYISFTHSKKIQSFDMQNNLIESNQESNEVYLRQEGQKIFRYINDQDCQLYDFSMEAGDITIFNNCQLGGNVTKNHKVSSVGTFYWNGEIRTYFNMTQLSAPFDWFRIYEGIGSWQDWLNPTFQNDHAHTELICHQKNGEEAPIYYHTDYSIETCNSFLVSTEAPFITETIVYPNPGIDFIRIIADYDSIKIFDAKGNTVKNISITKKVDEYEVDISDLTPGLYFIFTQHLGSHSVEKFIKI